MRAPNTPDPFARSRKGLWRAGAALLALFALAIWLVA